MWFELNEKVISFLKSLQYRFDDEKLKLELDEKLNDFLNNLLLYEEAIPFFYRLRKQPKKIIIPFPTDINLRTVIVKVKGLVET